MLFLLKILGAWPWVSECALHVCWSYVILFLVLVCTQFTEQRLEKRFWFAGGVWRTEHYGLLSALVPWSSTTMLTCVYAVLIALAGLVIVRTFFNLLTSIYAKWEIHHWGPGLPGSTGWIFIETTTSFMTRIALPLSLLRVSCCTPLSGLASWLATQPSPQREVHRSPHSMSLGTLFNHA